MRVRTFGLMLVLLAIGSLAAADSDLVWIEGEAFDHGVDAPHPWYSGAIDAERLSGGAFASAFTEAGPTTIAYDVDVPATGRWTLWLRSNPVQARLAWRVDGQAWRAVDFADAVDRVNLAADGKPDLRFLAWVEAGAVDLAAGRHRFGVRFHSDNHHHGSLDVLVLTRGGFVPKGKLRPDRAATDAAEGWFAVDAAVDHFGDEALVDLRHLNEAIAGEHGRLRRQGDGLVLGDGTPVRIWGANAGPAPTPAAQDYLSRRLAKAGFNCARLHGLVADRRGGDPRRLDADHLARIHDAVHSNRQQGIYTHLSPYFPPWLRLTAADGTLGRLGEHPMALLFIDPAMQALYRAWMKELLTTPNPHTGLSLAEDPAVAFVELQNEDNLFFWTFTPEIVGDRAWRAFEERFASWAAERHGSVAAALRAWDGAAHQHDGGGRLGLYGAWHLTRDGLAKAGGAAKRLRLADQARFLAELQRTVYAELIDFLREDCGYDGLVVAGNWQVADAATMLGVDRWTTTVGDVIDKHGYFGGRHEGEASSYSVRVGHRFADRSALQEPTATPVPYLQIAGRPHIVSETAWPKPNRLNADAPLLLASYGALQGVDGYFLFATDDGGWNTDPTAKWPLCSPSHYGQSPAVALQYRRGDVAEAEPVVTEVVPADAQFDFVTGGIVEGVNDDARVAVHGGSGAQLRAAVDPLAYFVGPVRRVFPDLDRAPNGAAPASIALAEFVDARRGRVHSRTGELLLDSRSGWLRVDTPRSQAVAGHLRPAGRIELGDVAIRCGNDYATVHVISLDGAPLATSRRVLVQAYTRERLFGSAAADGVITALGRAPWNVERIDATVILPGQGWRAVVCDAHGYPREERQLQGGELHLPADAMSTVLTR